METANSCELSLAESMSISFRSAVVVASFARRH
jgi:hypothetical protein